VTTPPRPGGPRGFSGRLDLRLSRLGVVALLVVPIVEIAVIVAVGQAIGGWWTVLLLLATSVLGAWVIRREGGKAWRALGQALRSGRMPARELADGVVVLAGGTLLLLPGFVTDALGLVLVLPVTRPVARRLLEAVISRHLIASAERFGGPAVTAQPGWDGTTPPSGPTRSTSSEEVVEGEIVDED
jgi:UPF0716 protein FxsA